MNDICLFVHICDPGSSTSYAGAGVQAESSWSITKGLVALQKLGCLSPQSWHTGGTDPPHCWLASVGSEGEQAGGASLGGHRWGF